LTDEPIKRYCVVCGRKLPGNLSAYELVLRGAASSYGEGQLVFHCIQKHTAEQIAAAAAKPPAFHRASEARE
jgi:hypothetical protein